MSLEERNLLPSKRARKFKNATAKGQRRMYKDLRLKQKAANERMRQLEIKGIKSPAYLAVQAQLEVLGRKTKGDRGRRFSETGKATYNEMELQLKILNEFLEQKTSTLKGAKDYQRKVWESANTNNKLTDAGITREDWLNFWASMPDKKDRLYGSTQIVAIMRAYYMKNGKLEDQDKMSAQEIAEEIQNSKNLKSAYKALGITPTETKKAKIRKS